MSHSLTARTTPMIWSSARMGSARACVQRSGSSLSRAHRVRLHALHAPRPALQRAQREETHKRAAVQHHGPLAHPHPERAPRPARHVPPLPIRAAGLPPRATRIALKNLAKVVRVVRVPPPDRAPRDSLVPALAHAAPLRHAPRATHHWPRGRPRAHPQQRKNHPTLRDPSEPPSHKHPPRRVQTCTDQSHTPILTQRHP